MSRVQKFRSVPIEVPKGLEGMGKFGIERFNELTQEYVLIAPKCPLSEYDAKELVEDLNKHHEEECRYFENLKQE